MGEVIDLTEYKKQKEKKEEELSIEDFYEKYMKDSIFSKYKMTLPELFNKEKK